MASTFPASTTSTLQFYVPPKDGSRAFQSINATSSGIRDRNFTLEPHEVEIQNLRGNESAATLDTAGFQLFKHPAKHTAFANDAEIQAEYYPESIDLIKKLTGASRVPIRRRRPGEIDDAPDRRQPVPQTHVDQTPKSAVERVHRHLPADEAPELVKHRFQIINLWRPISHPAHDFPLGLCDFRSVVTSKAVLPVALVYPDREGETYGVRYTPGQKWTYFSGVTPEELILIKCVALYTPHTAFSDPQTPEGSPLRESIELPRPRFL
ncbi:hypothetical protein FB45DRAFT_980681 [Roridomyces roridus]|uniref:Uncharacterized protein n=1 Tax=Roridomyces roridus TaxID=1738132 RepID=A0AAD7BHL1_9AGAR|nr:hypothetical protein FB45DRAFT_980681 [Roridomyces roridus]